MFGFHQIKEPFDGHGLNEIWVFPERLVSHLQAYCDIAIVIVFENGS